MENKIFLKTSFIRQKIGNLCSTLTLMPGRCMSTNLKDKCSFHLKKYWLDCLLSLSISIHKNSLDLLGRDGALLVLAEHPESLLVPLLRVVVVVHVGQDIAKLLKKICYRPFDVSRSAKPWSRGIQCHYLSCWLCPEPRDHLRAQKYDGQDHEKMTKIVGWLDDGYDGKNDEDIDYCRWH